MALDLEKIQETVEELIEVRGSIYKLKESGTTWVLNWRIMGEDENYKLTTIHEIELRKILLQYEQENFDAIKEDLIGLINKD